MSHVYAASAERYSKMVYNPCGKSGLKLPLVSLGLWHNFGNTDCYVIPASNAVSTIRRAVT